MKRHAHFFTIRIQTVGWVLLTLGVVIAAIITVERWRPVPVSITPYVAGTIIVIDAGHGGRDPGAVAANGLLEKDVTLPIALHLERLLQRAAVHVMLTRRTDTDLAYDGTGSWKQQDLRQRITLGQEANANLFISIHANSFPSPIWSGAQTFYFPGREEDRLLAEHIQTRFQTDLGPNKRQAAAADYFVLRESAMPAVVVEVGFLSNPAESDLLSQPSYQQQVAQAIYFGIIDYLAK